MNIFITFDYELFLGRSTGSVEKCLLNPTQKYLNLAKKYNIKYVFFVDVLYLLKSQDYTDLYPELRTEYDKIVEQLKTASEDGHDIELHLHPQWYYSFYDANGWKLDYQHYKLSDCPMQDIENMIVKGCQLLYKITGVRPKAYRAGGYSFYNNIEVAKFFNKNRITYDSSVLMLSKSKGQFQTYDYSKIYDFNTYNFDFENAIKIDNGSFMEYPISCAFFSHLFYSFKSKIVTRKNKDALKVSGDGEGVGYLRKESLKEKKTFIKKIFEKTLIRASLDYYNACFVLDIYKRARRKNSRLLLIIGHPKNATLYSFRMLENFVLRVSKNKSNKIITFRDL